jgi:hypothetical protein
MTFEDVYRLLESIPFLGKEASPSTLNLKEMGAEKWSPSSVTDEHISTLRLLIVGVT